MESISKTNQIVLCSNRWSKAGSVKGVAKGFASNKVGKDGLTGRDRAQKCGKSRWIGDNKRKTINLIDEQLLEPFQWIEEMRNNIINKGVK